MEITKKTINLILIEAIVVGITLVGFIYITQNYILPYIPNLPKQQETMALYFISGSLFHIIFEYTGINLWYAKEYCKLF